MKYRWKFCQCCYLNGHCENQDRGHKCETYPKQLEDEVERLQEQLKEANEIIKGFSKLYEVYPDGNGIIIFNVVKPPSLENYIKKWSVK